MGTAMSLLSEMRWRVSDFERGDRHLGLPLLSATGTYDGVRSATKNYALESANSGLGMLFVTLRKLREGEARFPLSHQVRREGLSILPSDDMDELGSVRRWSAIKAKRRIFNRRHGRY